MHHVRFKHILSSIPVTLCTLLVCSGCQNENVDSTWRDREIIIDGVTNEDEWDGARCVYDDPNIVFGIMNDKDYIYLSMATSDETLVRKITGFGMTVWFNETGKKDEVLGFHYPMEKAGGSKTGMGGRGGGMGRPGESDGQAQDDQQDSQGGQDQQGGQGAPPSMKPGGKGNFGQMEFSECEVIINRTGETVSSFIDEISVYGIEAAITVSKGLFVYELKFPTVYTAIRPYAIGTDETTMVGIGCITGAMTAMQNMGGRGGGGRGSRGGHSGGMPGGGGMGGGMGGRGGGGGRGGHGGGMPGGAGGMSAQDSSLSEKTRFWIRTELFNAPE